MSNEWLKKQLEDQFEPLETKADRLLAQAAKTAFKTIVVVLACLFCYQCGRREEKSATLKKYQQIIDDAGYRKID